ncbi:brachyurin-like [Anoplophora glabripennis]|uniref:brachyurin-like n=1 Tax=Anoplophora glabripennis TaxID=217634 RepID=UPI000873FCE8|nr:brachyurin-like [Anoplophora glabripennis]
MSLIVFLVALTIVDIGLALPTVQNFTSKRPFMYPNERTNGFINGRIIGGQEATPHAYPYQVGLYCHRVDVTNFCGGSLVSQNFVLTAAHCAEKTVSIELIFGAHNIEEVEETQVRQTSSQFVIHSGWDESELIHDIAVVRLPTPIVETDYIKIIRISPNTETYAGEQGLIAGWGTTRTGQQGVTPLLRYVVSDILTNDACKSIQPYDLVIQPTHLCLSGLSGTVKVGTCNGDSGGPLVVNGAQVGVVSFGYSDCEVGNPSVFTRLSEYRDWIRENSDVDV